MKEAQVGTLALSEREQAIREGIRKTVFFTRAQVSAWAVSAYRDALLSLRPPVNEQWIEEGVEWATPVDFAANFEHAFKRRFWDSCERSTVYKVARARVDQGFDRAPELSVFSAPQRDNLPQRGEDGPVVQSGDAR